MKYIFKILNIRHIMILCLVSAVVSYSNKAVAQKQSITANGTVMDTAGEPLIGATIIVLSTQNGIVTDFDGKFSIKCNEGDSLQISFIGYDRKVVAASASEMSITLTSSETDLDEITIVGVGYGTMRKSDLTGAISSVSEDDFNQGLVTQPTDLIQGKIAGLTISKTSGDPAGGNTIRLRGGTSLSASNSPLFVVDGIPGVDINTIQPSDIASVDVLKDASAAAIYGSRGANGVIIITTKNPKKDKLVTNLNSYMSVGTPASYYDLLSANQWRAYVRENEVKGAVDYGGDTDWQEQMLRNSVSQSHSLSFSSGNENSSYRASINYLQNQGLIIQSDLQRLAGALAVQHKAFNNKLKLDLNISSNFDNWTPINYDAFQRAYNLNPTLPVYEANGDYVEMDGLIYENPIAMLKQPTRNDSRNRFLSFAKLDFEIIKGLNAVLNASFTKNNYQMRYYVPSDARIEGMDVVGRGQRTSADNNDKQVETYLTYQKELGNHSLNLMGGYSYLETAYEGFGAQRRGFDTDFFDYNNLAAGQDYRLSDVYSYKGKANLISFFGRANYNFNGKYMFTATLRRDGSSRFGANNRWGFFPSASVAWRISDESFMESTSDIIDNLKLRVGYGITGNQDGIGEYKSLPLIGQTNSDAYYDAETESWRMAYGPTQNPNPDLKWEQTAQLNVGLDFSIFNKINGVVEYYSKKTSDLLYTYTVPQPPYVFGTILANVGDLSNQGVELSLNAVVLDKGDYRWTVYANVAHNKQIIEKLSNQVYTTDAIRASLLTGLSGQSNVYAQIITEGSAVGTFYGYKCLGLDESGNYIYEDTNNDGAIDSEDEQELGNVQPKITAGLGMSLSYKNFDLSFSMNGLFGQKLLNATAMTLSDDSRLPEKNVLDGTMNDELTGAPEFSDYWLESGSFVRLQNLTFAYNVPIKKSLYISRCQFYATGENLFLLTKYSGLDPEINITGLDYPGIENFNYYPRPRTLSVGVNLSF